MKKFLEWLNHVKGIALTVTAIVAVIAIGWKAYAHFQDTYVEDEEYKAQCSAWKTELDILRAADKDLEEAIAGLSRTQMINQLTQQMWWYQRKIDEFHQLYGNNCANCDQFNRDTYWQYRREYERLQKEIRKLGG